MKKHCKRSLAMFLAMFLLFGAALGAVGSAAALVDLIPQKLPLVENDAVPQTLANPDEVNFLTSTLQGPVGMQGFDGDYKLSDPGGIAEFIVQFVTPPSVALELMREKNISSALALPPGSFEEQALSAHTAFRKQLDQIPAPPSGKGTVEIFSEHHELFNGVYMRAPGGMAEQIAALPEVFAVTPYILEEPPEVFAAGEEISPPADTPPDNPFFVDQQLMQQTRQLLDIDAIHSELGITGKGVRVAMCDTGIDSTHPEFARYLDNTGMVPGWQAYVNEDLQGHGTEAAGSLIAMAPEIELWSFRRSSTHGPGLTSTGALEAARNVNADIIYTWGAEIHHPYTAFTYAVTLAAINGAIVTVAAHNYGPDSYTVAEPANSPLSIAIGAGQAGGVYAASDTIASFSGRGPTAQTYQIKPDVVASGYAVRTTNMGGGYITVSGTSFAGPVGTGVVALVKQAFPDAPPSEIKARVMNTARPLAAMSPNRVFAVGAGFVLPRAAITSDTFVTAELDVPVSASSSAAFAKHTMASLSFGEASPLLAVPSPNVKTITASIHNDSDETRTYTVEPSFTNNPGNAALLTFSRRSIAVGPGGSAGFSVTITLKGNVAADFYEGYVLVKENGSLVARLPFALVNLSAVQVDASELSFDLGGSPTTPEAIDPINVLTGTNISDFLASYHDGFPSGAPEKEGYTFDGWYMDDEFLVPLTATTTMPAAAAKLYAAWELSGAPSITSENNTSVVNGTGGTFQVTAIGAAPITYSLSGQPAGVTINSSGLITIAAAVAADTYTFTITASNGISPNATQSFTLTVTPALVAPGITGPTGLTLTTGYAATASDAFTVTGNPAPTVTTAGDPKITWNNTTKKLDIAAGLAAGTYPVVLTATNGVGTDATANFTLTVNTVGIAVTSAGLDSLKVGVAVAGASITYTLSNASYAASITPTDFAVSGLPAGLSAGTAVRGGNNTVTVAITGTPTAYSASGITLVIPSSAAQANVAGASGAVPVTGTVTTGAIAKGDLASFPAHAAKTVTYTTALTLADIGLDAGYAWNPSTTALTAIGTASYPATYTLNENYNPISGSISVTVNKAAGDFGAPAAINVTYVPGMTLASLNSELPAGYAWVTSATSLSAGDSQTFAATFTDPGGKYNTASGSITVNVAKAAGVFGSPSAINTTYTATLTLAGLNAQLPTGYAWVTPATPLSAGDTQAFAAIYTDASGNYNVASGTITVNVAKANAAFGTPAAINATYVPGMTLASLDSELPAGYAWTAPATPLAAGSGQAFAATYQPAAANYNPASGTITVNVAKADAVFGSPAAINATYVPGLTLASLNSELPAGYAWTAPTTALNAGSGQGFAATYQPDAANYNAASGTITVNVAKASAPAAGALTREVVIGTPQTISCDLSELLPSVTPGNWGTLSYVIASAANGDGVLASVPPTGPVSSPLSLSVASVPASDKTATITFTVTSTNYADFDVDLIIKTVDKIPVTISGVTMDGKTYNGLPCAYTGTPVVLDGAVPVGGLTLEVLYGSTDGGGYSSATAPTNAGDYKLTLSIPAGNAEYTGKLEQYFTISKKEITVKADNKSAQVGSAQPAYTYTLVGTPAPALVAGDTLLAPPTVTCPTADMNVLGTYPIVPAGADAGPNYALLYQNGTLTATAKSTPGTTSTYAVTVSNDGNGTASASSARAGAGAEITLTATPGSGYQFKEWQVLSGGVTVAGGKFTMPAQAVEVKAIFEPILPSTFALTVTAGANGSVSGTESGDYAEGTAVSVTATADSGYHFTGWAVDGAEITDGNAANPAAFAMPAGTVLLTANFEQDAPSSFAMTVNGGTGSGGYVPGQIVAINASAPPAGGFFTGKRFKEWASSSSSVTFADKNSAATTFVMPSSAVTATAVYEDVIRLWGKNTNYISSFLNWLLCIVCFGWIWMAF